MKYLPLGTTDLRVSRIAFGCWQLSPRFWGDVAIDPWEQALRRALDLGVNFIDTADAYGNGHAETCLGRFLAREKLRDRFVLATKFYWHPRENGDGAYPDTRHDYILKACEASLRRLRTDCIDLYQIHAFDPLTRPEETAAALLRLRQEGKIRWIGVSNLNPEAMRMYGRHLELHCLQPGYSLLDRAVEQDALPYCQTHRIGVIAYSTLYRGLLAGTYSPDHVFTDARAQSPLFQGRSFARICAALEDLRPFAAERALTLSQLAMRWVLTHPAVTCAIAGIKTAAQIEDVVPAAADELTPSDWHFVAGVLDSARREALAPPGGPAVEARA